MASGQTRPKAEISDPVSLAHAHRSCVDTSNLPDSQAAEVKRFVKAQGKSRGLFRDFPWTIMETCEGGHADAIIRLEFPLLNTSGMKLGEPIKKMESDEELLKTKVVLEVSSPASGKQLYKLQAGPLGSTKTGSMGLGAVEQRRKAMYNAFAILGEDLRSLRVAPH